MQQQDYRKTLLDIPRLVSVKSLISSFEAVRPAGFAFEGEMHDFWELVYIADGKAGITADERVYTLNAGQLIFHKPMEFHRICSVDNYGHKALIMAFDAVGEGMQVLENRIIELDEKFELQINQAIKKASLVLEMDQEGLIHTQKYSTAVQEATLKIEHFLLEIIKRVSENPQPTQDGQNETYRLIVRVLNENAQKNLSLTEIASLCHLSVSNLKKVFRRYSDKGVMKYFTHVKIRKAINMLDEGLSVAQVSEHLGFSSANYFSVVFKRETGYTPGAYRKRLKKGDLLILS
jgi:AraC-like DNA-binding protein